MLLDLHATNKPSKPFARLPGCVRLQLVRLRGKQLCTSAATEKSKGCRTGEASRARWQTNNGLFVVVHAEAGL